MKKAKKVMGALALTVVVVAGIMWWVSSTSNPWNAKTVGDIDAPAGYTRVEGSYAEFMRRLPLKKRGSRVQLFTGGDAGYQKAISANSYNKPHILYNARRKVFGFRKCALPLHCQ